MSDWRNCPRQACPRCTNEYHVGPGIVRKREWSEEHKGYMDSYVQCPKCEGLGFVYGEDRATSPETEFPLCDKEQP